MPKAILQKIDDIMNCEDIAMNFLISHFTRKPPIKISLTFGMGCFLCGKKGALSKSPDHYQKRNYCLNFLTEVYGYNPLIYTQFRATSILDQDQKEHCFQDSKHYVPHGLVRVNGTYYLEDLSPIPLP